MTQRGLGLAGKTVLTLLEVSGYHFYVGIWYLCSTCSTVTKIRVRMLIKTQRVECFICTGADYNSAHRAETSKRPLWKDVQWRARNIFFLLNIHCDVSVTSSQGPELRIQTLGLSLCSPYEPRNLPGELFISLRFRVLVVQPPSSRLMFQPETFWGI